MNIPRATWWDEPSHKPGWLPTQDSAGNPLKPLIVCACGVVFRIGLHHVHADGRVTASFYHPVKPGEAGCADFGPGCGFHEFVKLEGYDGPEFPPDPR